MNKKVNKIIMIKEGVCTTNQMVRTENITEKRHSNPPFLFLLFFLFLLLFSYLFFFFFFSCSHLGEVLKRDAVVEDVSEGQVFDTALIPQAGLGLALPLQRRNNEKVEKSPRERVGTESKKKKPKSGSMKERERNRSM